MCLDILYCEVEAPLTPNVALPPSKNSLSKYSLTKVSDSQTFHDVDLIDNLVYPDENTFPPPPSIAGIDKALSSPLEVYDVSNHWQYLYLIRLRLT